MVSLNAVADVDTKPFVSVVITAYKRANLLKPTLESIYAQEFSDFEVVVVEDGDDGGATEALCGEYPVRYFRRHHRPGHVYSNPAVPNNIGIRKARGEVILLQNAECRHDSTELIYKLSTAAAMDKVAAFATVEALNENGTSAGYYVHPILNRRPFFFCGAIRKEAFMYLQGFDEDYIGYGYDDNDMADRLKKIGYTFRYEAVKATHLWHPSSFVNDELFRYNQNLYNQKSRYMEGGIITEIRNFEREWGQL